MPFIQPSAMAPRTRIPDSLISQLVWKRISFSIGSTVGKISSRKTLAKTSSAAAEHFPVKMIKDKTTAMTSYASCAKAQSGNPDQS